MLVRTEIDRRVLQNEIPTIIQYDSFPINFYLLHNDETTFDLAGYEATFKMREFTSTENTISTTATITNVNNGIVTYTFTTTDTQNTGLYLAEIEVLETTTNKIYSSQLGKIIITEEI